MAEQRKCCPHWLRGRGSRALLPLGFKKFQEKIVFFVSSGKNEISPLLAPSTKILKNTLVSSTLEKILPTAKAAAEVEAFRCLDNVSAGKKEN